MDPDIVLYLHLALKKVLPSSGLVMSSTLWGWYRARHLQSVSAVNMLQHAQCAQIFSNALGVEIHSHVKLNIDQKSTYNLYLGLENIKPRKANQNNLF